MRCRSPSAFCKQTYQDKDSTKGGADEVPPFLCSCQPGLETVFSGFGAPIKRLTISLQRTHKLLTQTFPFMRIYP